MRSSSTSGESFTGIYKVLQVKSMNEATIDDMKKAMDQLHRMPEDGKVILFALFQLELASLDHSGRYSNCLRRELAVLFARVR